MTVDDWLATIITDKHFVDTNLVVNDPHCFPAFFNTIDQNLALLNLSPGNVYLQ